ncbi:hypothetical protein Dimus_001001 [Dionaea muscipula]
MIDFGKPWIYSLVVSDYFFDVDSVVFWGILCKGMIFFMFWAVAICGDLCCSCEASTGSGGGGCARLSPPGDVNIWYVPRKKDIFSKPDDILTAAEKHIQEHGIDDFKDVINKEG